ncbi:hypothetical protein NDU88_010408 [Pleurodeles waltl]|uniref:Uncharacterized protein n=1 Tax=Pleurodeles waltl TaxID=8319 RepID=A0AAV7QUG0_PLEWA|nr:hypothetical protein NDU88_010408 [Pleurodeles waltl]
MIARPAPVGLAVVGAPSAKGLLRHRLPPDWGLDPRSLPEMLLSCGCGRAALLRGLAGPLEQGTADDDAHADQLVEMRTIHAELLRVIDYEAYTLKTHMDGDKASALLVQMIRPTPT